MDEFLLLAGDPALDLLNTAPVSGGSVVELLPSWERLVDWELAAGLIAPIEAESLRAADGGDAVAQVIALREDLRAVVLAVEGGGAPPGEALAVINAALEGDRGHGRVVWADGVFARVHVPADLSPTARATAPVARAVANLLTTGLANVRKCGNPACVLHYRDTSKNHSRRWCSMALCGNRTKVAAFHRRHRSS